MKNKIIFILKSAMIFFTFALLGSCESFFDSVVEIDLPPFKPRLVVAAYWETGSDSLAIFVSKSRSLKDNSKFNVKDPFGGSNIGNYDTVANAKVELFRNDQLLGEIPNYKVGYHLSKGKYKIDTASGVRYKIRVSAPNLPTVEAEQVTQAPFKISQTLYKKDGAFFQDPNEPFASPRKGDEFSFQIDDNGIDENYYSIGFRGSDLLWYPKDNISGQFILNLYLSNLDPLVESNFLDDKIFNGKVYRWRHFSENYFGGSASGPQIGDTLKYSINSHTKDWFLFNKTRQLYFDARDNVFFSEPVIFYTNIKNGEGIFSISSKQDVVAILK